MQSRASLVAPFLFRSTAARVDNAVIADGARAAIFSPLQERINLALPILFAFLVIIAKAFNFAPTALQDQVLRNSVYYVFLNSTHVAFTLLLFFLLPQVRQLASESFSKRRRWVFLFIGFALALGAFSLCKNISFYSLNASSKRYFLYISVILYALADQHILGQFYGLSLLYNVAGRPHPGVSAETLALLEKLRFAERVLFQLLFVNVLVLAPIIYLFFPDRMLWLRLLFALYAAGILALAWWMGRICPSGKFTYLLRLALWCYPEFHFVDLAIRAIHGIEYLFVTEKMLTPTPWYQVRSRRRLFWGGTIIGYPLFYIMATRPEIWLSPGRLVAIVSVVFCLVPFLEYLHYYLDSVIFRFKDPEVRQLIGPLLAGNFR